MNLSDETWNEMCYLKLLKLLKPIMEGCLFETFRWDLKWDVLFETFETSQTYHGGLLIWNFQMRLEMRCAIWNFWNFSNLSWRVAYLKLSDETWNEMYYLKLLKLLKPIMEGGLFETFETFQTYHGGLLIWNFQMRLEMRCTIWNFWNFSNLSWRVPYFKISDDTWNEMYYLKLLKLLKPIMEVAYLKLSDETWNEMCYLKLLKLLKPIMEGAYLKLLKLFKPIMEGCLFETFRWDLKWDVLFETFETSQTYHGGWLIWNFWNFSNLSWRVAYLKLSDETWNEMCYLKLLKLLKPIMEGCLFESFRWDLKWDVLYETSQTYHRGLLIWNFLKLFKPIMEGCLFETFRWDLKWDVLSETSQTYHGGWLIWNFLKLFKPIMEGCLFETFRWHFKWDVLFETFETSQTYHGGLLIWNFQMTLEMRCAIWNFWNFSNLSWRVAYLKLLTLEIRRTIWNFSNLSWRVAYLKLSDDIWNEMCYLKLLKLSHGGLLIWIFHGGCAYLKLLKLLKPIMEGCLFETFRWDLKWDVLFETFETSQTYHGGLLIWNFQMTLEIRRTISNFLNYSTYHGELLIWNFQMRFEMRCAIWNFWNFSNLSWRVAYLKLETFQTYHGGLLIWIFQMRLEMRCAIWNFWNFSNLSWKVGSDDIWNEMCYLKLLKLLKPIMEGCLFETFRWDLKWDVLFETFETSQIYHGGWLIWNFWNFSNLSWRVAYLKLSDDIWNEMCYLKLLKLLKHIMEGCLFESFRWDLKWDVLYETSQTYHGGWLIWNFLKQFQKFQIAHLIWSLVWKFQISNLPW